MAQGGKDAMGIWPRGFLSEPRITWMARMGSDGEGEVQFSSLTFPIRVILLIRVIRGSDESPRGLAVNLRPRVFSKDSLTTDRHE